MNLRAQYGVPLALYDAHWEMVYCLVCMYVCMYFEGGNHSDHCIIIFAIYDLFFFLTAFFSIIQSAKYVHTSGDTLRHTGMSNYSSGVPERKPPQLVTNPQL